VVELSHADVDGQQSNDPDHFYEANPAEMVSGGRSKMVHVVNEMLNIKF
jgi:hypothetical protein